MRDWKECKELGVAGYTMYTVRERNTSSRRFRTPAVDGVTRQHSTPNEAWSDIDSQGDLYCACNGARKSHSYVYLSQESDAGATGFPAHILPEADNRLLGEELG
jgi:hypothetical protein